MKSRHIKDEEGSLQTRPSSRGATIITSNVPTWKLESTQKTSGFTLKRNSGLEDCLNDFERQHKIPRREFDARYYERLSSPSSSPDTQQKLYPSIELAYSLRNNTPPSSNKSPGTKDKMVIDLDSPEAEDEEAVAERNTGPSSSMTSSILND